MKKYTSVKITIANNNQEHIMAILDDYGFEGIIESEDDQLEAFIAKPVFDKENLKEKLKDLSIELGFEYSISTIDEQNWNETWESNFEPVIIAEKFRIRAPFHPKSESNLIDILIEPKMSFGTGHHATTSLMLEYLLEMPIKGHIILDAGMGTGILAIACEKLGAKKVLGFDNEEWAYKNAIENAELNNASKIQFYLGDAHGLPYSENKYDFVLANITKNILKEDIPVYLNYLEDKGTLVLSGFFEDDVEEMDQFLRNHNMEVKSVKTKNNWASILAKRTI